jgi:hypothetical protein
MQTKKFKTWGTIGLLGISSFYMFKSMVYDRLLPITTASKFISEGKFSDIVIGNFMMLCYFKSPVQG